ncbi:S-layer homology domain-containing protein [Anaerobacillus sp. MEB173]|uniref:S-layer homology domain-containing protein n=1 Tax=Anaerobacillus sp. MEB173 TaxID=3383345 RepID=UPI003F93C59C
MSYQPKSFRRFLAATLSTSVLVTSGFVVPMNISSVQAADTGFGDVQENKYYTEPINKMADVGFINGMGNKLFGTEASIKRRDVAVLFSNVFLWDLLSTEKTEYSDIPSDSYYSKAVSKGTKLGIFQGKGKNKFAPNDELTRGEMAVLLSRAFQLKADPTKVVPFNDIAGHPFENEINAVYQAGLTNGISPMSFGPDGNVTRAQFATLLYRSKEVQKHIEVKQYNKHGAVYKLEDITDTSVISGITYQLSDEVKKLLHTKNRNALVNSYIEVEKNNHVIEGIKYLAVTKENAEIDGDGISIEGDVVVLSDNVHLKNVHIKGKVIVEKLAEKFSVSGDIDNLHLQSPNPLTFINEGTIKDLTIGGGGTVSANLGSIGQLSIKDVTTKLLIEQSTTIGNLILPPGVKPEEVILNYEDVKGKIREINGKLNPSAIGGGSGGGSSSPALPGGISNLQAAPGNGEVTLSWDAALRAEGYEVYFYKGADLPTDDADWNKGWPADEIGIEQKTHMITDLETGDYMFKVIPYRVYGQQQKLFGPVETIAAYIVFDEVARVGVFVDELDEVVSQLNKDGSDTQEDIDSATLFYDEVFDLVSALSEDPRKQGLLDRLVLIKQDIDLAQAELDYVNKVASVEVAVAEVEILASGLNSDGTDSQTGIDTVQQAHDDANSLIESLREDEVKLDLVDRLTVVQAAIDSAQAELDLAQILVEITMYENTATIASTVLEQDIIDDLVLVFSGTDQNPDITITFTSVGSNYQPDLDEVSGAATYVTINENGQLVYAQFNESDTAVTEYVVATFTKGNQAVHKIITVSINPSDIAEINSKEFETFDFATIAGSPASIESKAITNFNYRTIYAGQANLKSKPITHSNFQGNRKQFTISDGRHNIAVDLWWDIPTNGFTYAGVVGSAIDSYIQQYFNDNNIPLGQRTLTAFGFDDTFTISSFATGSENQITLSGLDWEYFFETNVANGTDEDRSANRTFTISDGENTATILLEWNYQNIDGLVNAINNQLNNSAVTANVSKVDEATLKIETNDIGSAQILALSGTDVAEFFSEFNGTGIDSDYTANRSFTISDGVNSAVVLLDKDYNSMDDIINEMNATLASKSVNISAEKINDNQLKLKASSPRYSIDVTGENASQFFE